MNSFRCPGDHRQQTKIAGTEMKPNEIKVDLEKRKKQVALVSAYSTLRNYINLLCTFLIVGVVSWTIFKIILVSNIADKTARINEGYDFFVFAITLLQIISGAAIIIFIAIVARVFALAIIDSVDLQLLSNRRNALERADSLTQKD